MKSKTPDALRPPPALCRTSIKDVTFPKLRTEFFKTKPASRWILEEFLREGFGDTPDFVEDARRLGQSRTLSASSVLVKQFCFRVWTFYETEDGKQRAELIKSNLIAKGEISIFSKKATIDRFQSIRQGDPSSSLAPSQGLSAPATASESDTDDAGDAGDADELQEPWKGLLQACVDKVRNQPMKLESLNDNGLTELERWLFQRVLYYLSLPSLSLSESKDMLVAATGIVDLRAAQYKNLCSKVAELSAKVEGLIAILETLRQDLTLGSPVLVLRCNVRIGKISQDQLNGNDIPFHTPMIELVRHIGTVLERGLMPVSEMETVGLWKTCLEILSCGKLKFLSGEHICNATRVQKRLFLKELDINDLTDSGRKVDLMLKLGDFELLNTEAKAAEDPVPADIQYKKNIRINHAIRREASRRGIELPRVLFLDLRGLTAMICSIDSISPHILCAGPAYDGLITLPSCKDDLERFLSGHSPHLLWRYVEKLIAYQECVRGLLDQKKSSAVTNPKKDPVNILCEEQESEGSLDGEHESATFGHETSDPGASEKQILRPGDLTAFTPVMTKRHRSLKNQEEGTVTPKRTRTRQAQRTLKQDE
ncbi:MAG: hypothetical protein J3Q66DRAFT_144255 [Benniella sp.]|nr:MAG: hypothetical protein J3Q66DRAFT_144255 [Benniella sp.]